jgi:hypothetical protein
MAAVTRKLPDFVRPDPSAPPNAWKPVDVTDTDSAIQEVLWKKGSAMIDQIKFPASGSGRDADADVAANAA